MGVEQQNDAVDPFGEPFEHSSEVVASVHPLLLPGQDSGGVDDRDALQHGRVEGGALEAIEESVSELAQGSILLLGVDDERVSWDDALLLVVHDGDEAVGGRLGPYPDAGEVPLEQVFNERGFTGGVLAHEQDHRLRVEVRVFELRRVILVELVVLLERQQLVAVDPLEPFDHIVYALGRRRSPVQPAEHLALTVTGHRSTLRTSR